MRRSSISFTTSPTPISPRPSAVAVLQILLGDWLLLLDTIRAMQPATIQAFASGLVAPQRGTTLYPVYERRPRRCSRAAHKIAKQRDHLTVLLHRYDWGTSEWRQPSIRWSPHLECDGILVPSPRISCGERGGQPAIAGYALVVSLATGACGCPSREISCWRTRYRHLPDDRHVQNRRLRSWCFTVFAVQPSGAAEKVDRAVKRPATIIGTTPSGYFGVEPKVVRWVSRYASRWMCAILTRTT